MADRGPNPNLWMVTAGPRQPLKGVFFTQKFLSQNFSLLAAFPKHLLLANCVIVDQAVVQLNCSEQLSFGSKQVFPHNCSIIARHYNVYPGDNSGFKARV